MTGIIDAHHHIWRQADLPWLVGPMQPRIFGPFEPIRRDYLIKEYLEDIARCGVTASVYVQANWAQGRGFDEAAWVQQTADEHGWPQAVVAYADCCHLILGGAWPVLVDTGYRSNQIMEPLGMRGLQFHDRPAVIEHQQVAGRIEGQIPGPVSQPYPRRNWFPV